MSVKNRIRDRDATGRILRSVTSRRGRIMTTPGWWVCFRMNRPKRRENRRLCKAIVAGADPESIVFPLGNRRPHLYYW